MVYACMACTLAFQMPGCVLLRHRVMRHHAALHTRHHQEGFHHVIETIGDAFALPDH